MSEPGATAGHAAVLRQALELHQKGRLDDAETLYRAVLAEDPEHFDALHFLGVVHLQRGQYGLAAERIERAIGINPGVSAAHSHLGLVLLGLNRPVEAIACYDRALALNPDDVQAWNNRGNVLRDLGRLDEAVENYNNAIRLKPDFAEALNNRGNAWHAMRRPLDALSDYERALRLNPDYAEARNNRGIVLLALLRLNEALEDFHSALRLRPDYPEALNNLGNALRTLKRPEAALAGYERALKLRPDFAEALNNRGLALQALKRPAEALASFDSALRLNPGSVETLNNRGNALRDLGRPDEAIAAFDAALQRNPDFGDAYYNRGSLLTDLKRYREAADSFAHALLLSPDCDYALGYMFHAQLHLSDWRSYRATAARIATGVERGERCDVPFPFLVHSANPAAQLQCARLYVAGNAPASPDTICAGSPYRHDKIRIAYLSADFHEHATAYLTAGLFDAHDRSRFDVRALSFGGDDKGAMRGRLEPAFEEFVDVTQMSDRAVAELLRAREIDIAIDLKGFTARGRPGIFSHRGAPLQVNYLGFPGTMGADYIDYILADARIVPPEFERFYSEKLVRLPDSYQVNGRDRRMAERMPSRAELGLSDRGFVFCCFNNNYKITPDIFDVWMRLLKQVGGSVLWLLESSAEASRNLAREAERRGVSPDRLVFAPRMDLPEHLARHRQADLFLDTVPCNAHTTASDALWAGLPLVTCMGETFASRVAGSLLHALGLPELVTHSLGDYEALALTLATEPERLANVKAKLARNRDAAPLFDTDRFRRHLEAAYVAMQTRHLRGEPPASFDVPPLG